MWVNQDGRMKIAIAQINATIGGFEGNRERILSFARNAGERGAELVLFPELSLCGYPPMDLLDHNAFVEENRKSLRLLQRELPPELAVAVGYVDVNREMAGKALQNSVALLKGGEVMFRQAKTLLPTYDVFDEARYFEPAKSREVLELGDERIGIAICEDIWWEREPAPGTRYPIDPVQDLLDKGATVILSPSASPFYSGKLETRFSLLSRIGKSSGVPVLYANTVGGNDSLIFDGYSMATDSKGKLTRLGAGFEEDLLLLDSRELREGRTPGVELPADRWADIYEALKLGLKDYLAKTGFSKVHLGLSGGVDSALVATIAADALGAENVEVFLLPSQYSSAGSISDSEALAANLGVNARTVEINETFGSFLTALEPHFRGRPHDIAEENIQARIRGTILMAYSNKFGSLLLTTGNKSELAVGYCTLYGDMSGGLGVIGDLLKTEVYELCGYINRDKEIIPEAILSKPPSAELRPEQRDDESLPPYEVLDEILVSYLIENKTRKEMVAEGADPELVERILNLVGRSEYKRRQAPPVLKVSPKAFGNGRRMPIARRVYEGSEL
ncbi:MAG: NAD+ synthase [Spirochaetaceae bacterium]